MHLRCSKIFFQDLDHRHHYSYDQMLWLMLWNLQKCDRRICCKNSARRICCKFKIQNIYCNLIKTCLYNTVFLKGHFSIKSLKLDFSANFSFLEELVTILFLKHSDQRLKFSSTYIRFFHDAQDLKRRLNSKSELKVAQSFPKLLYAP